MWGNLLDQGLKLAEKAKKAAEDIDKQLNESVGLQSSVASQNPSGTFILPISNVESVALSAEISNEGDWDDDEKIDVSNDAQGEIHPAEEAHTTHFASDLTTPDESSDFIEKFTQINQVEKHPNKFDEENQPPVREMTHQSSSDSPLEQAVNQHDGLNDEDFNEKMQHSPSGLVEEGKDSPVSEISGIQMIEGNTESRLLYTADGICQEELPSTAENVGDEALYGNGHMEHAPIRVSGEGEKAVESVIIAEFPNDNKDNNTIVRTPDSISSELQNPVHNEESSIIIADARHFDPGFSDDSLVKVEACTRTDPESSPKTGLDEDVRVTTADFLDTKDCRSVTDISTRDSTLLETKIDELQNLISQRENQLLEKNKMMLEMESQFEGEKRELSAKIISTKEEAKRRISLIREKLSASESHLLAVNVAHNGVTEALNEKEAIIVAIRVEGEKLARKQADMEKAVRNAKSEARDLRESLEDALRGKEDGLIRIGLLEEELATTKYNLSDARVGESNAEKLENELRLLREENERRQSANMSLEHQVKELKSKSKELTIELEEAKRGAAAESEQERKKLLREQTEFVKELENTIRLTEREAATREDALRHELEEVRKRWQDAVRRADALSIDIQSSTAPLLRQLDSLNRQNRSRSSAWTELETQLRSELDEHAALNEKVSLELNEWKSKFVRMERLHKDEQMELAVAKDVLEENSTEIRKLQEKVARAEAESLKIKNELGEVERLGTEGISKVRSEMARALVEKDERYQSHMENIRFDLSKERELRGQFESQLKELIETAGTLVSQELPTQLGNGIAPKVKTLLQSEGQVSILASTLSDLAHESDSEAEEDADELEKLKLTSDGSFAAIDQLTSSLKVAKRELNLLRRRLEESEKSRNVLLEDLASSRSAKEKLPLFEAKVQELLAENIELAEEVRGLREDIVEVRHLYRAQLNMLLEEKAATLPSLNASESDIL